MNELEPKVESKIDLGVTFSGLSLKNPIMPASGTFAEGILDIIDGNKLGAFVTKSFTAHKRSGNSLPRICEIDTGSMLNSIGIPSKGIEHYIKNVVPIYQAFNTPLIVSISADTANDFAETAVQLSDVAGIAGIEANISCPNLEANGKAFSIEAKDTATVMKALRKSTKLPLWAKLSPNTSDIISVAKAVEAEGGDAIVVANTLLGMSIDIDSKRPTLGNIMGGYSGAGVKPVNLRMTYQCYKNVKIPIIGCGGIFSYKDAIEYMLAGATALQVGTASFIDPNAMPNIIDDLYNYCKNNNISKLSDLTGQVIDEPFPPFTAL